MTQEFHTNNTWSRIIFHLKSTLGISLEKQASTLFTLHTDYTDTDCRFCPFIANDQPLYAKYKGESVYPAFATLTNPAVRKSFTDIETGKKRSYSTILQIGDN